jgi:type IV secretory pathway TrbD component
MALRQNPIYKAGHRANLFLGADRELIMTTGLLSVVLIFSMLKIEATIFGVILWITTLYLLREMAKADPRMRHIYIRHIKYKPFYPARSTPHRNAGSGSQEY